MENVVLFPEYRYLKYVAWERTENLMISLLMERRRKKLTVAQCRVMHERLLEHFFKLEKQKFLQNKSYSKNKDDSHHDMKHSFPGFYSPDKSEYSRIQTF
jgi:hypothetical protein